MRNTEQHSTFNLTTIMQKGIPMNLLGNIILNTYSVLVLLIIGAYSIKQGGKININRLYNVTLIFTAAMLLIDIISRLDGAAGTSREVFNHIGNFVLYLTSPIFASLWILFNYDFINRSKRHKKRLIYALIAINLTNLVILLFSLRFNLYYYIDANNIYHRGVLYPLSIFYTVAQMLASFLITIFNRKYIDKKLFYPILIFPIPSYIGVFLQTVFYGYSFALNGVALSLLIVFLFIQNHNMYIDYLTGVYNRKMLEIYLNKKVHASLDGGSFSAIMIDLDNFKNINDNHGHLIGDKALISAANLFRSCIDSQEMLARYGGDEFIIVLNTYDEKTLVSIVEKIKDVIQKFNQSKTREYTLGISMGYAVYDRELYPNAEQFIKHIDRMMYRNKGVKPPPAGTNEK